MSVFSKNLLSWFQLHGRKDLPWQQEPIAYRVWVSEIMLQQTQVKTVIPYYEKFMQSFPNVQALAAASNDEVLHHWSGLGYYARARNLHKTAILVSDEYSGEFPDNLDAMQSLPGIGRSTAGAILSLAYKQRQTILDGNVKRVLTRFAAVEGWPGKTDVQKRLWKLAESHTPEEGVAQYTQAIMDLGATLCTRSKPACERCPVQEDCQAHLTGRQKDFPFSKPKKAIPTKRKVFLILRNDENEVLLEKRPPTGIWGGLWSLPECEHEDEPQQICRRRFACDISSTEELEAVRHTFSHYHLEITPLIANVVMTTCEIMESDQTLWYNTAHTNQIGLAAPVVGLLETLQE